MIKSILKLQLYPTIVHVGDSKFLMKCIALCHMEGVQIFVMYWVSPTLPVHGSVPLGIIRLSWHRVLANIRNDNVFLVARLKCKFIIALTYWRSRFEKKSTLTPSMFQASKCCSDSLTWRPPSLLGIKELWWLTYLVAAISSQTQTMKEYPCLCDMNSSFKIHREYCFIRTHGGCIV